MLTSAVLATSGFAATTEINQDTTFAAGADVSLANETSYVFANRVTLHNYTTIQGPTTTESESASFELASGASSANVIQYKDQIAQDDSFMKYGDLTSGTYYRTTGSGSMTGNIDVAEGIEETTQSGNIAESLSGMSAGDTVVLIGDDDDAVPMTDDSGSTVTVSQNIANEKTSDVELYIRKG